MGRTLVTGGGGFVGKALVHALKEKSHDVVVLDLQDGGGAETIVGSILNRETVKRALQGVTQVFHLAGNAQLWAKNPDAIMAVNAEGTRIAVEECLACGVNKFVYCSSLTTLVGKQTPIGKSSVDETIVLPPEDLLGVYPASKRHGELIVEEAVAKGLNASIAIPTEPLGAGDEAMTPPTQMMVDFLNGKTPASIDCILNFVPVESLADGLIAIAEKGRSGERYILGGDDIPMRQLLSELTRVSGRKMPTLQLPYAVALGAGVFDTALSGLTGKPPKAPLTGVRLAGRRVSFSSDKAERYLGWQASPFPDALNAAFEWMQSSGKIN